MVVTSVIEEFCSSRLDGSMRAGDKANTPILPTNSTLIPSWAIFFPSRIRTMTYVKPKGSPNP